MNSLYFAAIKRRKIAQEVSRYRSLVASPASLGSCAAGASLTALVLPQNARLAISLNAITTANDISVSVGTRTMRTTGAASAVSQKIGWHERSRHLVVNRLASCPAGTLSVWLLTEWGQRYLIATGTFS
jgi:hypothetical protein